METKTMYATSDLLSGNRCAHSTQPTLAGINVATQGSSVSVLVMGAAEYVRERIAADSSPFFGSDVETLRGKEVTVSI